MQHEGALRLADDRTRITLGLSQEIVVPCVVRVGAKVRLLVPLSHDTDVRFFSAFRIDDEIFFAASFDTVNRGFSRHSPIGVAVSNMGDVFVDALPVWLVDASNLEFVHEGQSLQGRVEVYKSLLFADTLKGGAVSFLVQEATRAHVAFHKPLVGGIEDLGALFHWAIAMSVAFGRVGSHNGFGGGGYLSDHCDRIMHAKRRDHFDRVNISFWVYSRNK